MKVSLLSLIFLSSGLLVGVTPVSAGRTQPTPRHTPAPVYPASLEDTGKNGVATIRFTVSATGAVEAPEVVSADDPAFAEAALVVLPEWRFDPATRDGVAVATKVELPFQFKAPVEQQFNALLGRKVFLRLPATTRVLTPTEYGERLRRLNRVPPVLPNSLKGRDITEVVRVRCIIDTEGFVINPELVELPAIPQLAAPALMAAAMTRFAPPRQLTRPVHVSTVLAIDFGADYEGEAK